MFGLVAGLSASSMAAPMFFNSTSFANNATVRNDWLTAIGISGGDFLVDFENFAVGINLNGVDLGGGVDVSHPTGTSLVQSNSSFFGGSNPIGTRALALAEVVNPIIISFATPADYIGGFDIDMPGCILRATFADNTTAQITLDATATSGNTAEFWGIWRNDAPGITRVEFLGTNGGDGEWGLDNLEYGLVPEPGTLLALAAGLGAAAFRRRRR
jgi:hypothetical protein